MLLSNTSVSRLWYYPNLSRIMSYLSFDFEASCIPPFQMPVLCIFPLSHSMWVQSRNDMLFYSYRILQLNFKAFFKWCFVGQFLASNVKPFHYFDLIYRIDLGQNEECSLANVDHHLFTLLFYTYEWMNLMEGTCGSMLVPNCLLIHKQMLMAYKSLSLNESFYFQIFEKRWCRRKKSWCEISVVAFSLRLKYRGNVFWR